MTQRSSASITTRHCHEVFLAGDDLNLGDCHGLWRGLAMTAGSRQSFESYEARASATSFSMGTTISTRISFFHASS